MDLLTPADLLHPAVFPAAALVAGLVVGSFANVCIHRIPLGQSVVTPPSRCPRCSALVRPFDNVPVLAWLWLGGRCRSCRAPISARYPAVEAVSGVLFWALAAVHGPTPRAGVLMVFVTALLVLVFIDYDHQILPNVITRPGIALGIAAAFLPGSPVGPLASAASAAAGYLVLALVAESYRRLRGVEGLGQGDWKMVAMIGAFLGWESMLLTVFLASLAGTVVGLALMARGRTLQHALPLGTFLGAAAIAVVFVGTDLLRWYRGLFPEA